MVSLLPGSCPHVAQFFLGLSVPPPNISCSWIDTLELSRRTEEGQTKTSSILGQLQIHFMNLALDLQSHPDGGSMKAPSTFLIDSNHKATSLAAWTQVIGLYTLNAMLFVYIALMMLSAPAPLLLLHPISQVTVLLSSAPCGLTLGLG